MNSPSSMTGLSLVKIYEAPRVKKKNHEYKTWCVFFLKHILIIESTDETQVIKYW